MTGSSLDAEDLVQESLARAFERLDQFDADRPLKPWLFRIAHNLCVDFLRRQHGGDRVEFDEQRDGAVEPEADTDLSADIDQALLKLVTRLPRKERACVVLKDVLDYSLSEIAEIVDSSIGGVKAALHRGRSKLKESPGQPRISTPVTGEEQRLLEEYVDRFSRQDWDAVCDLLRADARLEIVDVFTQSGHQVFRETYFHNHTVLPVPWQLGTGRIDGVPAVLEWRFVDGDWRVYSAARIQWQDGRIVSVRDYMHVTHVLADAEIDGETPTETVDQ